MRKFTFTLFVALPVLCGCHAKFVYNAPPDRLNPDGPTVAVLPISDVRTNRAMDKALESGYLADVQHAIASEFESMNAFHSVIVVTNGSVDSAAVKVLPILKQLEWEIPNYGRLQTEAFVVGLLGGGIGGGIWLSTGTDVWGHSNISLQIENSSTAATVTNSYVATVKERRKKASADAATTKAEMMAAALARAMEDFKADFSTNATLRTVAGQSSNVAEK